MRCGVRSTSPHGRRSVPRLSVAGFLVMAVCLLFAPGSTDLYATGTWSAPLKVSYPGAHARSPRLATGVLDPVTGARAAHIVWEQDRLTASDARDIWHATLLPNGKFGTSPYRVGSGVAPDISADLDGVLHIAWFSPDSGIEGPGKVLYRWYHAGAWRDDVATVAAATTLLVGDGSPSILAASTGIYVVWPAHTNPSAPSSWPILFGSFAADRSAPFLGATQVLLDDPNSGRGRHPRLASTSAGQPSLVWLYSYSWQGQTTDQLWWSERAPDGRWIVPGFEVSVDYSLAVQRSAAAPSLAYAPDGALFAVWEAGPVTGRQLYYADYRVYPNGFRAWSSPTSLTPTSSTPARPSVQYGANRVHTLWFDGALSNLRYQEAPLSPAGDPLTWSQPWSIAQGPMRDRPATAVADDGTVYAAWVQRDSATGFDSVYITWRPAPAANTTTPTPTATATRTPTPTRTPTTAPPTVAPPSLTPSPTASLTVSPTPSASASPSATPKDLPTTPPTATRTPTATPSPSPPPTATPFRLWSLFLPLIARSTAPLD